MGRPGDHLGLLDGDDGTIGGRDVVETVHRYEVGFDRPAQELHVTCGVFPDVEVVTPPVILSFGDVGPLVIETPPTFGACQRTPRRQLGAVADERDLGATHQLMRCAPAHLVYLTAHPLE